MHMGLTLTQLQQFVQMLLRTPATTNRQTPIKATNPPMAPPFVVGKDHFRRGSRGESSAESRGSRLFHFIDPSILHGELILKLSIHGGDDINWNNLRINGNIDHPRRFEDELFESVANSLPVAITVFGVVVENHDLN